MTPQLTHGSLFAGIGGFDAGFRDAGMRVVWQVEIEPFPRSILRTRFPEAELLSDVRECGKHNLRAVDVLTAGFPCQDLSVAGKRAGLAGARSGLFWEVVRILGELRPAWFVLENVPGLFSSNEGRDFAVILDSLDELRYGVAWRVLNSQFFGVAQRRRRVFIVGRFGKPCPAEVLFESEGGVGDIETSGEARAGVADETCDRIASPIRAQDGGSKGAGPRGGSGENRVATSFNIIGLGQNGRNHAYASERTGTIQHKGNSASGNEAGTVIVQQAISSKWAKGSSGPAGDEHHNLTVASLSGMESGGPDDNDGQAGRIVSAPSDSHRVRDFASLPKGLDSARYRALGNAVTVNVAEWIGKRIVAAAGVRE